ncbi:MAG: SusC/RagA family TonB-linked outer membrane protein [Bacteroidetes bacterium]|nr:SusC/RagA family TonB-linked outer membrane protein [Bacteroidota bacterium]
MSDRGRFLFLIILVFTLSIYTGSVLAQDEKLITIKGKITGNGDEPLPGVSIVEKGTSIGTITDSNGQYILQASAEGVLVFSSAGYYTEEIPIRSRSVIDFTLQPELKILDDFPGSSNAIVSIDEKNFNRGLINDPLQLIQGRVAGLIIAKPGGDPNGEFVTRLRGVQTISGSAEPLIVVDGFPGASLSSVDPADIETIEVLKDVAASSIYGLRGGNGVILIKIKTGEGKFKARYSGAVSFDKIQQNLSFMKAEEYRRLFGAVDFGYDTDWLDEVTRTGVSQVHNFSLSGGSNHTSYYASLNYRDIEGIAINTGLSRLNARFNLSQNFLKDKAKIGVMLASTNDKKQLGFNDVFTYAVSSNPTMPVRFDGTAGLTDIGGYAERDIYDYLNPVSIAKQAVNDNKESTISGSLNGEFDLGSLVKGLGISLTISSQTINDLNGQYSPSTLKFGNGSWKNGFASRSTVKGTTNFADTRIYLQRETPKWAYSVAGGYSYQDFRDDQFDMQGGNFLTDAFLYNNMSAAQDFDNGLGHVNSYASTHKLVAFYTQLDLSLNERYFINVIARYEGSSRFGLNKKWALFPAVSLGLRLDELLRINFFEHLQGRISVGSAGRIPESSYLSLQRFGRGGSTYMDGSYKPSYNVINNENQDLGSERTNEVDIGFDFAVMNGKIYGSFDWYQRNTKDIILPVRTPVPPNLFWTTYVNVVQLRNSGIELSINWDLVKSTTLNYTTNFMFATYNTTVVSLSNNEYEFGENGLFFRGSAVGFGRGPITTRVKVGEPLGDFWGPVFTGVDANGYTEFADLDRDGYFCYCYEDHQVIGNGLPDWSLGWSNKISAGKFELDIFFRGVFGHDILNEFRVRYENLESTTLGNWNVVTTQYFNPNVRIAVYSNIHVENASYFLLDNITIGYNLPEIPKLGISEAKIFITGQNLFTFSGYSGVDPEVRYMDSHNFWYRNDPMVPGIERRNTYLPSKTVSLGIRFTF